MASARVLSTNELGTIRYQRAAATRRWPIEVRLLPQPNDTDKTVYKLHTACHPVVPFAPTAREELRATLAAPPGALVYEVFRDGMLVSTGGLEVRCPNPPPLMSGSSGDQEDTDNSSVKPKDENLDFQEAGDQFSSSVDLPTRRRRWSMPAVRRTVLLSGARQLTMVDGGGPDGRDRWRVRFQYYELSWMVRNVAVIDAETCAVRATLVRVGASGFVGEVDLPVGSFRYRFRVIPHESLVTQMVTPTRLGWDDGAMTHAWEFMTWPLTVDVRDLAVAGACPDDALMKLDLPPDPPLLETTEEDVEEDDAYDSRIGDVIAAVKAGGHNNIVMGRDDDNRNDDRGDGDGANNNTVDDDDDDDANTEAVGTNSQYEVSRTTDEYDEYVSSDRDEYSEGMAHATKNSHSTTFVSDNSECLSSISNNHEGSGHSNNNYESVSTSNDYHPAFSDDAKCKRTPSISFDPCMGDGVFRTAPTPVVDWSSRTDYDCVSTTGNAVVGGERMGVANPIVHDDISVDIDVHIDGDHDTDNSDTSHHGGAKRRYHRSSRRAHHSPVSWGAVAVNAAMFVLGSTFTFVLGGAARRRSRSDSMSDISVRSTRRRSHSQASMSSSQ